MAKIKTDLSEDAAKWFTDAIGYMPSQQDLEAVFDEEPGLGLLIHHILDPQKYYQDANSAKRKQKKEA